MFEEQAEEQVRIQAVTRDVERARDVSDVASGSSRPSDYASASDEWLVAAIGRRDHRALEAVYDRYGDHVYSVAIRVVADAQVAEDVSQEVFVRLWRRPDLYDSSRGRFVTWLLSVTRNRAIDEGRSRGRRFRYEIPHVVEEEIDIPDDSEDPQDVALLDDDRRKVRTALAQLPVEQRRVIEMAYFGGFTQQEIAERLSQPLGTVKTRVRLGLQKLRAALIDQMDGTR